MTVHYSKGCSYADGSIYARDIAQSTNWAMLPAIKNKPGITTRLTQQRLIEYLKSNVRLTS